MKLLIDSALLAFFVSSSLIMFVLGGSVVAQGDIGMGTVYMLLGVASMFAASAVIVS